jgi:hypothetical protein
VGQWRWRLQARLHANGGPLSEPSRQSKWSIAAEGPIGLCSQRWAVETDHLSYRESALNDSRTTALAASVLCSAPRSGSWAFGISARRADERANDPLRPGGDQTHTAAGAAVAGRLSAAGIRPRMDIGCPVALQRAKDERGYSVLLEKTTRRRVTRTRLFSVELTGPASASRPSLVQEPSSSCTCTGKAATCRCLPLTPLPSMPGCALAGSYHPFRGASAHATILPAVVTMGGRQAVCCMKAKHRGCM